MSGDGTDDVSAARPAAVTTEAPKAPVPAEVTEFAATTLPGWPVAWGLLAIVSVGGVLAGMGGGATTRLSYAPEIATVMLRRQQANAVVAARYRIVEGAVGMVEAALAKLSADGVVDLDDERRAAMVSNMMVVLCSEQATQPIVNTGTLYS